MIASGAIFVFSVSDLMVVNDIEQTNSDVSVASRSPTYTTASTVQATFSWLFFGLQELDTCD
jgi:hypothetical protein